MPSRDPAQRFTDILAAINHIEEFTRGLTAQTFAANDQVIFAVKYAWNIISEAATKLVMSRPISALMFHGRKSVGWATGCDMTTTPLISVVSGC